jgi:hypothetical protein
VAVIGFVLVFPFPKPAIVLVILFAQVQYLFTGYYGSLVSEPVFPVTFQWLDEMLLLALLGNLVLTKLLKKEPLEKVPAMLLLAGLFFVGFLTAKLNGISLLSGLVGQRYLFEMVILYLAITNMDLDERFLKNLVYLLLGIGVLQAGVGLLELASKYNLYIAGNHDIVQGTWGGGSANHIGVFFLCLSFIALVRLRSRWHGPTAILFGIYVLLLVVSSCRTGIVLAPVMFVFLLREKMKNPRYWIVTAVLFVFLGSCLSFYYRNTEARAAEDLGADEFAFQFNERTRVIPIMAQVLRDNARFPLLGAGPGTYLTATGGFYGSGLYLQVESMMRTREVVRPFICASYAVVWMEYGIMGLVLFVAVLARLLLFALKREKVADSPFWKDYLRALQAIIIVYAVLGGIFPVWTHFQVNIYLWLFAAIGVRYAILRERRAVEAVEAPASGDGEAAIAASGPARPR